MKSQLPPIPVGPTDPTDSRRALARLALSHAFYKTANLAAAGVPTVCDDFCTPDEYIRHAAQLLASAQEVLSRAVVYARENSDSWRLIAEPLGISNQEARAQFIAVLGTWEKFVHQPSDPADQAQLKPPGGTAAPRETATFLDEWCTQHIEHNSADRRIARDDGTEDRMVSAALPSPRPW